jgi:hypothetical protein
MTLALEVDVVRGMLGSWLEQPERSGLAARQIAFAMAVTHLRAGYDVIVPQLLTRRDFVDQLRAVAETEGACFREIVLLDKKATVVERAMQRSEPSGGFSARALVAKQGNSLEDSYDRFVETLDGRPDAVVIDASSMDAAYAALLRHLAR